MLLKLVMLYLERKYCNEEDTTLIHNLVKFDNFKGTFYELSAKMFSQKQPLFEKYHHFGQICLDYR